MNTTFSRQRNARNYGMRLAMWLYCLFAVSALQAATVTQINPAAAAPGQSVSLTVSGASPVAANNLVNFVQGGVVVGQAAARAIAPITGTTLSKLTVTLPAGIPPTTKGLSVVGAVTIQIGAGGTPGPQKAFTYQSQAALLDVSPQGSSIADRAPTLLWQGKTAFAVLTGAFSSFRQGITKAGFGPGIAVGGGPSGGLGPVTVLSPTQAVASLTAAPDAPVGVHGVQVKTGTEQISMDAALTVIAAGKPYIRLILNTTLVAFENVSGSPQIQTTLVAYDGAGSQIAAPAYSLSVDPPGGVTISGGNLTFTQAGGYNITASATIGGQPLSYTASAAVLGAPLSPVAGTGLANKHMNLLGRTSSLMNNLLLAAVANDTTNVKTFGNGLKSEINGFDFNALAGAKLLGTNADPNTNYNVVDVPIGVGGAVGHLPTRAELSPLQRADDDTYLLQVNALIKEMDRALALYASLNPAAPTNADGDKIKAESAKINTLLESYADLRPSARVIYDNLPLVQTLLLVKLPAVSRANSQYILDLLQNGGLISLKTQPKLHDGVYHPGRDKHSVRKTQLGLLLGPLFGAVPFGNVMWQMYSLGIQQIELMVYVMALAKLIPTNDMLGISGTVAGLAACDNTVSIMGGTTSIYGFGFSPTVNTEVVLIGSQAVKPFYDCVNSLLGRLFNGKGPGDCKNNPKGCYDYIKGVYKDLSSCVDSIDPSKAKVDRIDPGDPRLGGATSGFDPCSGDFTDNTSEISVFGFKSQKTGTFDFVAILLVRNLDNGLQNAIVVNQF